MKDEQNLNLIPGQSAELRRYNQTLPYINDWKDAYWQYILDHSDVTKSGTLFVKFHADSRATFEKHVRARYKYHYYREEPKAKEGKATAAKVQHLSEKAYKKKTQKEEKAARMVMREQIQREVARVARYNRWRARWKKVTSWLLR